MDTTTESDKVPAQEEPKLTVAEWRTIHNALSIHQNTFVGVFLDTYAIQKKQELQQLMDKVRDLFISPFCQESDHDDSVKCCPDCERPNQFGELCFDCQRERATELYDEGEDRDDSRDDGRSLGHGESYSERNV